MSLETQALNSITFDINSSIKDAHYEYNGKPVPRVTEILSRMIHKDTLMYWANSLGFKGLRYKDVLNKAADIGTIAHSAIEKFLKEKLETTNNIPFLGFLLWYNKLVDLGLSIDIIFVEQVLTCQWFGGTLDALIRIGDVVYLIDFKTSNQVTSNYFLQLSAYRYMLKTQKNIDIDGVIVLQLDKSEPGFNEYLLNFNIPEHANFISQCENTFLALTYAYYNLEYTNMLYKEIF